MTYREHPPVHALAPYVTCFWELASTGAPHRVLPDGAMDVLFASGAPSARVIGPMTRAVVAESRRSSWVVGVRFRPGAAIALLGIAARELRDESAPLVDVWGEGGRSLDARLADAPDAGAAMRRIETELLARVTRARVPDRRVATAVATLRATRGTLPIPAVAGKVGISERQLERLFDESVGYGPKVFARVIRLESATRALRLSRARGSTASWARFALECGYSDQAHLIHEFRALAGVTPAIFARSETVSEIDNPRLEAVANVKP